jgi:hypothetical protein
MSDVSKDMSAGSCTVVDSPKVIRQLFFGVFFFVVGAFCWLADIEPLFREDNTAGDGLVLLIIIFVRFILFPLAIVSLLKFRVERKGYVVDTENDILEFPGGGIEAESWLSYFNPMYHLQGFKRHQRPLSEIRHVQSYQDTNTKISTDSQGRIRTRTNKKDILEINGDFGAVLFTFTSKGKRDQLYSAIVQLNEMGFPVVGR